MRSVYAATMKLNASQAANAEGAKPVAMLEVSDWMPTHNQRTRMATALQSFANGYH